MSAKVVDLGGKRYNLNGSIVDDLRTMADQIEKHGTVKGCALVAQLEDGSMFRNVQWDGHGMAFLLVGALNVAAHRIIAEEVYPSPLPSDPNTP